MAYHHEGKDHPRPKRIVIAPLNAHDAVVHDEYTITISWRFAIAVLAVYNGSRGINSMAEGVYERLIALLVVQLRMCRGLPRWTRADVDFMVRYLVGKGKMWLPENLTPPAC